MKYFSFVVLLFITICSKSIFAELISGPMVGFATDSSATVWAFAGEGKNVEIRYGRSGTNTNTFQKMNIPPRSNYNFTSLAFLNNLSPHSDYSYEVWVDGSKSGEGSFSTAPLPFQPVDYSYFWASCMSTAVSFEQPAWNEVLNHEYDLQFFHGDNVYSNTNIRNQIFNAHIKQREVIGFDKVLAQAPTYATWDDHDYGPNDSDGSLANKENSLKAFQDVWSNPSYGLPGTPGVFFTFHWGDVQYFVMDNRYHRTDPGGGQNNTQIGIEQRKWLLAELKKSRAPFKIILSGGSIQRGSEKWAEYEVELKTIMNFIRDNKIYGVMFQGGDVHIVYFKKYNNNSQDTIGNATRNPIHNYEDEMGYPVYDIISSGIAKHTKRPWSIIDVNTKIDDPTMKIRFFEQEQFKEEHELKLSDLMHEGTKDLLPHTPHHGQKILGRSTETIRWRTIGTIQNVNLEYNTGGGWKSIANNVSNSGVYNWNVPNEPSKNVKIRVSDASGSATGELQSYFEIEEAAPVKIPNQLNQITFKYPNSTGIKLKFSENRTSMKILNLKGQMVSQLPIVNNFVIWNGLNQQGNMASAGIYVIKLGKNEKYRFNFNY